ncbi:phosphotransferase family protein [Paenibacillus sp. GCM10023252]|uniref:phosphotransferase family protein n=1 Tax=Paenibacillus sp. GCM10023252 TaxID=3252649 RepID=UPI0036101BA0
MNNERQDHLSSRVQEWAVQAAAGKGAIVLGTERLYGGMSALMHKVILQSAEGAIRQIVVRQFTNQDWLQEEPDLARHEAGSLRLAGRAAIQTPELIAYDESGTDCGIPAVVMSMLPGRVILQPPDRDTWLDKLAEALVRIHAVDIEAASPDDADGFHWRYSSYQNHDTFEVPEWSRYPELWTRAIAILRGGGPKSPTCFIHRDYHPNNVLWEDGAVGGVVDWVNACEGPPGVDIGHCRVNLAQLYGIDEADSFLSAYMRYSHALLDTEFDYNPYWDLVSLADILFGPPTVYAGWTDLGMTGLTDERITERLDEYFVSIMHRLE